MNRLNRSAVFTFAVMLCAGCVPKAAPTVEYFRAHQDERVAQLQRCANDPGSLAASPACVNALQAADLERHDSLRDLPSMGLKDQMPSGPAEESAARQAQ
jgi:hypothetical protein